MTANFVVWEQNNRTDFTYNTTASQEQCISMPQTWSTMLANNHNPEHAWTPQNYRSCFDGIASPYTDVTYEIINATSNALSWQGSHGGGIYLFKARIIDPSFTYCDLSAYFALDVVGTPISGWEAGAVIGGSMGILLLLVAIAGIYYWWSTKPKTD